jgi:hypothetical protein
MDDPGGFGSGNLLPRPFSLVSWCIFQMEGVTSKRLPSIRVAEIPFDVRQNRYTKELRIVPHPCRQSKKIVDARLQNNGKQALFGLNYFCFSSRGQL